MLNAEAIRASLGTCWAGADLRALGSVSSTNDVAWAWAEAGCPEGTAVFAEEQVQGRGRHGRSWFSPRGRGLLMSVVLRPSGSGVGPAHITALAALAVAEAIEAEAGLDARIRWPNDVVLRDRKVAGVLAEFRGCRVSPCVVGIGVNVNTKPEEFPEELRACATSLAMEAGRPFSREALAVAVLRSLERRYREAVKGYWESTAECWRKRAALLHDTVAVHSRGLEHVGCLVGIDPLVGITLELPGGERLVFRAEDATRVIPASCQAQWRNNACSMQ